MEKARQYTLNVKVTVTPMEYLQTSGQFNQAVSESLRVGTEMLRQTAKGQGLIVLDSTHHYEDAGERP